MSNRKIICKLFNKYILVIATFALAYLIDNWLCVLINWLLLNVIINIWQMACALWLTRKCIWSNIYMFVFSWYTLTRWLTCCGDCDWKRMVILLGPLLSDVQRNWVLAFHNQIWSEICKWFLFVWYLKDDAIHCIMCLVQIAIVSRS